jgi:hypothetical protein
MSGQNRLFVTDGPVEFEKNRVKFKTSGIKPIIQRNMWSIPQNIKEKPEDHNM